MTTAAAAVIPPVVPPPAPVPPVTPPVAAVPPPVAPPVVPPVAAAVVPDPAPVAPVVPPVAEPVQPASPPPAVLKAPAKYALVVPEKGQAHLTARDLQRIEDVARGADLTNEDAQALLDEQLAIVTEQAAEYRSALVADKDYGGAKLAETDKLARLAIDRVRPAGHPRREAFLAYVNRGGGLDHVEVASFLADLGKKMSEDAPVGGAPGGSLLESAAEKLYKNRLAPPAEK